MTTRQALRTPPSRSDRLGATLAAVCLLWAGSAADATDTPAPNLPPPALAAPSAQAPGVVAAWLARYTNIALNTVVSVGDEYIVAVLSSQTPDPAKPRVLRLEIRAEMTDASAPTADLLRSLSASLEINCTEHSSHFIEVRTFAGPNLTGAAQVSHPSEGWVANPRGSYFEDIDAAVCTPNAPRPLVAASTTAKPSASPADLAAMLRPAQTVDAPPPRRGPLHAPVPVQAAPHGGGEAQIVAAPSQAAAEAALSALRAAMPTLMSGLATRIERIDRGGVIYYRVLISGFTPPSNAATFCRQLAASGRGCISR